MPEFGAAIGMTQKGAPSGSSSSQVEKETLQTGTGESQGLPIMGQ